jgi:hypothetical protein
MYAYELCLCVFVCVRVSACAHKSYWSRNGHIYIRAPLPEQGKQGWSFSRVACNEEKTNSDQGTGKHHTPIVQQKLVLTKGRSIFIIWSFITWLKLLYPCIVHLHVTWILGLTSIYQWFQCRVFVHLAVSFRYIDRILNMGVWVRILRPHDSLSNI